MNHEHNFELREFSKNLHLIVLPSSLWGIHIHPQYEFIAILHIQIKLSKVNIDKGILVTFNSTHNIISTSCFIQNEVIYIPALSTYIKAIPDLSNLINIMHNLKLCPNADKTLENPQCNKYIDLEKLDAYCNSCLWDKKNGNLWKEFNSMQDMIYINSMTADVTVENLIDENNSLCCLKIDEKLDHNSETLNESSYICEICKKTFSSKTHLRKHLQSHTNNKVYICEICSKTSNTHFIHQRHLLTHSNNKPNLCNVCGKTFCQGYRMKDHLLTHSSERPFQCTICHKKFAKNYNLKLHQNTHLGVRSYICSTCGKTYTTQSNLSTHIRSVHTNKKPYECNNCQMSFVHPRHLRIHMRKHTGEKPYKCDICSKTFAKNIHLTIHMRIHTGEKPHICSTCGKGFTTTGNLNSHKRIHHKT